MATINEELNKLETTKADIKSALVEKGLNPTDVFSSYALNIRDISTGGGDIDFSKIGYSYTPLYIQDGLKYGELLYNMNLLWIDTWDSSSISTTIKQNIVFMPKLNLENFPLYNGELNFTQYPNMEIFPDMKFGNVTMAPQCFNRCDNIKSIRINADSVKLDTSYQIILKDKNSLKEIVISAPFDVADVDMGYFLSNCTNLETIDINFTGAIKKANLLFNGIGDSNKYCKITKMPDCSNLTTLDNMFVNASYISEMGDWDIGKVTSVSGTRLLHSIRINSINLASLAGLSLNHYLIQNVTYMVIKNLGKKSSAVRWDLDWGTWGVENDYEPLSAGARQSVIDSLITYSFDRATEYGDTNTFKLSTNTFNLLTPNEIAQITAKGYTLTT